MLLISLAILMIVTYVYAHVHMHACILRGVERVVFINNICLSVVPDVPSPHASQKYLLSEG